MNFPNVEKGSPEEVLMNLQRGQTTYARVYETLCRFVYRTVTLLIVCLSSLHTLFDVGAGNKYVFCLLLEEKY
jgi:hypothetical protein